MAFNDDGTVGQGPRDYGRTSDSKIMNQNHNEIRLEHINVQNLEGAGNENIRSDE